MSNIEWMTKAEYNKLKDEIEHLESVVMPEIAQKIAEARAEGDLKENAEYHGQRDEQGRVQAKINAKKDQLVRAQIFESSAVPKDQVSFGSTVRVMNLDLDEEETFILVGATSADPDNGKIPVTSPLGQGLLGTKVGQEVAIEVPGGIENFKILDISVSS